MPGLPLPADQEVLDRCAERLIDTLDSVDVNDLERPTPCTDWNVQELLEHVAGGNWFTLALLGGASSADALVTARSAFGSADLLDAVRESASEQSAAFASSDMDAHYDHVRGSLIGHDVLRLRIHDVAIHTWDLLQAVNPKKGLDPVYVRWAVDELARPGSITAQYAATGFARPRKPYELLLAFGRRRTQSGP